MTEILPYVLEVDGQEVIVTPDPAHEFTATTEQVALGYGVSVEAIRSLKTRRGEELLEGKHWTAVANRNAAGTLTLWTKRGIVRLGFFIRSKRARLFRDMAEDLVIAALEAPQPTAPALITASAIGASLGKSRNAVLNELSRRKHIAPVACGISHGTHTACYLFPLDRVTAAYAEAELLAPFQPYTGHVTKGPSAALNNARRGVQTRMGQRALPRGLRELDVDTLGRVIAVAIKAALA